jgi:hypothetical protein
MTIIFCEVKGKSGVGGIPPLPFITKPFLAAASLLAWQACSVVCSEEII